MKKISLVLALIIILSLCSCRKVNQTDTDHSSNNFFAASSEYSSDISNLVLPERNDPSSANSQDKVTNNGSYDYSNDTSSDDEEVSLTIYVDNSYYRPSISAISFILYNENKNKFTYKTDFFLQIYEDGDWKYYPTKNGEIEYKNYTADSETYIEDLILNIKNKYETPLKVGTYRIVQENDNGIINSDKFSIVEDSFFDGYDIQ